MAIVSMAPPSRGRPYLALGRRIQAARLAAGLTQRELAERVSVSAGYPPAFEGGRARPDAQILREIARVLNVDYSELAVLAGYAEPVLSEYPSEVQRDMRWIAGLPAWLRETLRSIADRMVEQIPVDDDEMRRRDERVRRAAEERGEYQPEHDEVEESEHPRCG